MNYIYLIIILIWGSVTYWILFYRKRYTEKQLVEFGNYILSAKRKKRIHFEGNEHLVSDADIANFIHEHQN